MDGNLTREVGVAGRTRRAVLGGAVGAVAAIAAQALGRPFRADAANGDPIRAGEIEDATASTGATTTSGNGLQGSTTDGNASGVFGENTGGGPGVAGNSANGNAVTGASTNGDGVLGVSFFGHGVTGVANAGTRTGVLGKGRGRVPGLMGWSAVDDLEAEPTAPIDTGVYGFAKGGGTGVGARGVIGETLAGRGVSGIATTGIGVLATSGSGMAIEAQGRVSFSTSGLATVSTGARSATVSPGVNLVANSRVLCTLESNQSGLAIQRVTKNVTADTFKVFLSKTVASGKSAKVAWFVIG